MMLNLIETGALSTLAENSPLIAVMLAVISALIYTVRFVYKIVQAKDKQLYILAENNVKLTALYEARLSRNNDLQENNSKEHQELLDISKASHTILKDLKSKLL